MLIECYPLSIFETNTYIIKNDSGKEEKYAAVIDPADGADSLYKAVYGQGYKIRYILLTHGHRDHTDACEELRLLTGAEVIVHGDDAEMINNPEKAIPKELMRGEFKPVTRYRTVSDGDALTLGDIGINIIHTPGHTAGGVCYIISGCLFSGDTLFKGTIGNTSSQTGNAAEMKKSLLKLKRLAEEKGDMKVYPGHGGATMLMAEVKGNPYINGDW